MFPLAFSILLKDACPEAFDLLLAAPDADCSISTRYLNVSLQYLAAAVRDERIFEKFTIRSPPSSAGVTALGHSLLHIACLPEKRSDIQSYLRGTAAMNSVHNCVMPPYPTRFENVRPVDARHPLQRGMVRLILKSTADNIKELGK